MKQNDFDKIAAVYDWLARFVFGKNIIHAQKFFLNKISDGATVLILGGGTGEILAEIVKNKNGIQVCYVELSPEMISIAKKKFDSNHQIQFIEGTENNIPSDKKFDVVITNFYLDLFSNQSLKFVLEKIKKSTTTQALWLVTDFVNDRLWHRAMLKMMYLFFRITCNIEATNLPNWRNEMIKLGGIEIDSKFFYGKFIKSSVFQF
ncbi:MAG TPA: hypothetical protein DGG95_15165 [Cytophagales bacterium]|jgi:tRNA (cmo5U34)-methyltransferase|nr:hypothetical protein [Cytophagales bacterium]